MMLNTDSHTHGPTGTKENNKKPAAGASCIFVTHDECWNETSCFLPSSLSAHRFDVFVVFLCFYVLVCLCCYTYETNCSIIT